MVFKRLGTRLPGALDIRKWFLTARIDALRKTVGGILKKLSQKKYILKKPSKSRFFYPQIFKDRIFFFANQVAVSENIFYNLETARSQLSNGVRLAS